jgi:hypothetical protein
MKSRALVQLIVSASAILLIGAQSLDADARGRAGGGRAMAGGGGFAQAGAARGGSFAAHRGAEVGVSDRARGRADFAGDRRDDIAAGRDDRQDYRDQARDDRQDFRDEARDDRYDYYDDHDRWDNWATGAAVVAGAAIVGSAITAAAFYDLDCTTLVVDGITYSNCGGTWYQPAYSGGDVTYVVVEPPPGY